MANPTTARAVDYGIHVASYDESAGQGSIDPAFAELFRSEDAAPHAQPAVRPGDPAPVAEPESPFQAPATPAPSAASESGAGVSVETGRLFRSQGVRGSSAAVLALTSDHGGRLRTLARTDVEPPAQPHAAVPSAPDAPVAQGPVRYPEAMPVESMPVEPAPAPAAASSRRKPRRDRADAASASHGGLTARAVYALIIGVTLVVAFINAKFADGKVGWPTGLALVIVTVYCALKVRRDDDIVAIITPPIACFLTGITAAQVFVGSAQRSLLNRAVDTFFTLADNWYWIIGATVAAAVIVLVRRRR